MLADFTAQDIECLARTAAELWLGDPDDLSQRQIEMLERVCAAVRAQDDAPLDETAVPEPHSHPFPDAMACEQANRTATFHPQHGDDERPCIEIYGILVFAYLDPSSRTIRVSVHLDSASGPLVRPDGTVPLRVEVEDTVLLP